jgi:hypothetical protein
MKQYIQKFNAFLPYYFKAHDNKLNKLLHFIGANLFFICLGLAIVYSNLFIFIAGIFIGYALPHIGHHHYEANKSLRSSHPLFCVLGAFILYTQYWKKVLKWVFNLNIGKCFAK